MGFWILLVFISVVSAVKQECPGGTFTCPDSATCCQLADKSYGCCPMENAVCCDDHIHCCPENSKCASGMCLQNNNRSVEIHSLKIKNVICDDKSVCPDETTCCRNPHTKRFGCCPMENAVCCNDGLHCCPEDTTCNLEERKCDGDGYFTHMYDSHKKSFDSIISNITLFPSRSNKESIVICPDQRSQCPDGNTCCKMPNQGYSCCPLLRASCCIDGLHCCPEHMQCDATSRYCNQGPRNVTSLRNIPAKMYDSYKKSFDSIISNITLSPLRSNKESSVICPDEESQCPDGYTCCKLPNQDYGCCPFVKASCCKDGLHCCPEHMHCDATSQYCSQGPRNVTSLRHIPAKKISSTVGNACPDHSSCENTETCCKSGNSTYGCCRYADATCCADLKHCCPSGMICDVKHERCVRKEDLVVSFLNNLI